MVLQRNTAATSTLQRQRKQNGNTAAALRVATQHCCNDEGCNAMSLQRQQKNCDAGAAAMSMCAAIWEKGLQHQSKPLQHHRKGCNTMALQRQQKSCHAHKELQAIATSSVLLQELQHSITNPTAHRCNTSKRAAHYCNAAAMSVKGLQCPQRAAHCCNSKMAATSLMLLQGLQHSAAAISAKGLQWAACHWNSCSTDIASERAAMPILNE